MSDEGEDVLELWACTWRCEVGLVVVVVQVLEDNGDDVIANVSFALQLLFGVFCVGKQGWNVEHDFMALVDGVDGVLTSCVSFKKNGLKWILNKLTDYGRRIFIDSTFISS